jgi:hypothetical protein
VKEIPTVTDTYVHKGADGRTATQTYRTADSAVPEPRFADSISETLFFLLDCGKPTYSYRPTEIIIKTTDALRDRTDKQLKIFTNRQKAAVA